MRSMISNFFRCLMRSSFLYLSFISSSMQSLIFLPIACNSPNCISCLERLSWCNRPTNLSAFTFASALSLILTLLQKLLGLMGPAYCSRLVRSSSQLLTLLSQAYNFRFLFYFNSRILEILPLYSSICVWKTLPSSWVYKRSPLSLGCWLSVCMRSHSLLSALSILALISPSPSSSTCLMTTLCDSVLRGSCCCLMDASRSNPVASLEQRRVASEQRRESALFCVKDMFLDRLVFCVSYRFMDSSSELRRCPFRLDCWLVLDRQLLYSVALRLPAISGGSVSGCSLREGAGGSWGSCISGNTGSDAEQGMETTCSTGRGSLYCSIQRGGCCWAYPLLAQGRDSACLSPSSKLSISGCSPSSGSCRRASSKTCR